MYKKRSDFFDSNLVYFVIISLFICIRIIAASFEIGETLSYIINMFIQIGLMFSLSFFMFSILRRQKLRTTLQQFGIKKMSLKAVIVSVIIGILVYILTIFIASFFSGIISAIGFDPDYGSSGDYITSYPVGLLLLNLFTTAVLPGFCEEVAHRGMLCSTYKKVGLKWAVIVSGLLFGLMHLNIEQFFYASIIGCYFGFISIICENLWPTIIMHFMNNAIGVYLTFASVNGLPLGNISGWFTSYLSSINPFSAFFVILIIIVVVIGLIAYLSFILFKEIRIKSLTEQANEIMKQKLREELFEGTSYENQVKENKEDGIAVERVSAGNGKEFIMQFVQQLPFFNNKYKPVRKDKIFLITSFFIGIVTTICTLIWGMI